MQDACICSVYDFGEPDVSFFLMHCILSRIWNFGVLSSVFNFFPFDLMQFEIDTGEMVLDFLTLALGNAGIADVGSWS